MYKLLFCRIILFLGMSFLFGGGIVFGQNETNCRDSKPDFSLHGYHFYTCEYKTTSEERMSNYCERISNSISSWPSLGCPNDLECHICVCGPGLSRDKKGRCCEDGNIDKNGVCCPGRLIPNENGECVEDQLTPITPIGQGQINITESTQNPELSEDTKNKCPLELQDSQGNCCKKMYYDLKLKKEVCCEGILLNTNVPFIGQCIVYRKIGETKPKAGLVVDEISAFPILMGGLSKILVSMIILSSFLGLLVAGVMISASGSSEEGAKTGRKIIGNIVAALALLGASGVILQLINPNFFG